MRDDLPPAELQGLRPVPGNVGFPERWARSMNRACTAWLLERGLLDPDSFNAPVVANGSESPKMEEPKGR